MPRRVLLLYNTPKARRYFRRLEASVAGLDVRCRPLLARSHPQAPDPAMAAWLADYSLRRKRARYWAPAWRTRWFERALVRAARGHYGAARRALERERPDCVGVWGGQAVDVRAARAACADVGVPAFVFETGVLPGTTTCDPRGVNFDNSVPRDPAFYAAYGTQATLPERLQQRPSKVQRERAAALPRRYVFVPFQVWLDSQVLLYSPWVGDMRQLYWIALEAWRATLAPLGIGLVFKSHPTDPQPYADLHAHARREPGVQFADGNPTQELIDAALGVVTLNSTVGIEALLRGRAVITLGQAFYAIPGVAAHARDVAGLMQWMQGLADGSLGEAVHRDAFLRYLAHDYCIPGHHERPGQAHFTAIGRRLSDAGRLVPATAGAAATGQAEAG